MINFIVTFLVGTLVGLWINSLPGWIKAYKKYKNDKVYKNSIDLEKLVGE